VAACSFCGKRRDEVDHLVAGPAGVGICAECARLAHEVAAAATRPPGGDLLLVQVGRLVTNDRRRRKGLTGELTDAAVVVRDGQVTWVGPEEELPAAYRRLPPLRCGGRAVIPAFADPHTHLIDSPRSPGGGLRSTADLSAAALARGERLLKLGAAAVGITCGWGSDEVAETAGLALAVELGNRLPLTVTVRWVTPADWPSPTAAVAARLASGVEVDLDGGGVAAAQHVARWAARSNLEVVAHARDAQAVIAFAEQHPPAAVHHLQRVGSEDAAALAALGVVVVITPSTLLAGAPVAARMLWDAGVTVAIASDAGGPGPRLGPASAAALAVWGLGLRPDEALRAATRGGPIALGERDRGWLGPGAAADLLVLDHDDPLVAVEHLDAPPIWQLLLSGEALEGPAGRGRLAP
jgi:imidazolonepropionase